MILNTGWGLVIGLLAGLYGVIGLITGRMTLNYTPYTTRIYKESRPFFILEGRTLPAIFTLVGAIDLVLLLLYQSKPPQITQSQLNSYSMYVGISGLIVSGAALIMGMARARIPSQSDFKRQDEKPKHMSLYEAAKFLKMPDYELLEMARNGGIQAREVNGEYVFDKEVISTFREMLVSVRR